VIRKQTLVNAERYVTEELKTHEKLQRRVKSFVIEQRIYNDLGAGRARFCAPDSAKRAIGVMDCLASLPHVWQQRYVQSLW
jgi:DNA mismatch repair protein MutS